MAHDTHSTTPSYELMLPNLHQHGQQELRTCLSLNPLGHCISRHLGPFMGCMANATPSFFVNQDGHDTAWHCLVVYQNRSWCSQQVPSTHANAPHQDKQQISPWRGCTLRHHRQISKSRVEKKHSPPFCTCSIANKAVGFWLHL